MTREQRIAALKAAVAERILIIDGAMGTRIQRYKFDEATFRGKRFAVTLNLCKAITTSSQADPLSSYRRSTRAISRRGRYHLQQHLQLQRIRWRLRHGAAGLDEPAAASFRLRRRRRGTQVSPESARGGALGPTNRIGFHLRTSTIRFPSPSKSWWRPTPSRRVG
jgi:hypothetical protein